MSDLKGVVGELNFVLTIKRKETGEEFTIPMVGHVMEQALPTVEDIAPETDPAADGDKE